MKQRDALWRFTLPCLALAAADVGLSSASAAAQSALEAAAASLPPKAWVELPSTSITAALAQLSGSSGMQTPYTDDMVWDPTSQQAFTIGADHLAPEGPQFSSYRAATDSWQRLPRPGWLSSLTFFHGYDHSAMDQARGVLFHRPFGQNVVHRYVVASETWDTLPNPTFPNSYANCCDALEYVPPLGGLLWVRGSPGEVWLHNTTTNAWSQLGTVASGSTWQQAEYNPVHRITMFTVGGTFYEMSAAGAITPMDTPPIGLYDGSGWNGVLSVDPVSGDFLVLTPTARALYSYAPAARRWTAETSPTLPDLRTNGVVATPVSNFGVTLFAACSSRERCSAYLYRHAPSTNRPAAPLNLTVQ